MLESGYEYSYLKSFAYSLNNDDPLVCLRISNCIRYHEQPRKMNFLMQLSKEGVWTNASLRKRAIKIFGQWLPVSEEPVL